jgi:type IV pilus assembly protein PilA
MNTLSKNKGFTLLELLVVIAILAVLAAVTVVVINPAELLARARDTQRTTDLAAIRSALGLYLTDHPTPDLDGTAAGRPTCGNALTNVFISSAAPHGGTLSAGATSTAPTAIGGTGWIPIDLPTRLAALGSPLASYPIDPTNSGPARRFYTYACRMPAGSAPTGPHAFQLIANLESAAHTGPAADRSETRDGGVCADLYEAGTVSGYITAANLATLYGVTC